MHKFRIKFAKTGRAAYISHLDTMRTFQRAIARAKLPAKHTEGFNPHAYISIALPLSLGYTSECEYLDLILLELLPESEILEKLNAVLPEGIKALGAYEQEMKVKEIEAADYILSLEYDNGCDEKTVQRLDSLFTGPSLTLMKKSKRGETETDIIPMIRRVGFKLEKERIFMKVRLAAGNNVSLNPEYLFRAISQYAPDVEPDFTTVHRIGVLCTDGKSFR